MGRLGLGIFDPFAEHELFVRAADGIHILDDIQELIACGSEGLGIFGRQRHVHLFNHQLGIVGKHFAGDMDDIKLIGVHIFQLVSTFQQCGQCLGDLQRVIITVVIGLFRSGNLAGQRGCVTDFRLAENVAVVRTFQHQRPGLFDLGMVDAVTANGVILHPLFQIGWFGRPGLRQDVLLDDRIVAKPFHHQADTDHFAGIGRGQGCLQVVFHDLQVTAEVHLLPQITNDVPDPLLAVEGLGLVPDGITFAVQVQTDHVVIRDSTEQCRGLGFLPEITLPEQEPALKDPNCIRIGIRHGTVNTLADLGDKFRITGRRINLVKAVGVIQVISTIQLGLFFDEAFADFPK